MEDSRERVYASWKSDEARRVLDVYYAAKKDILSGKRQGALNTPEEWAGSLLVVHGAASLDRLKEYGSRLGYLPKPKRIKRLLTDAINADLAIQHGIVSCVSCQRQAQPTLDWRCRPGADETEEILWCCPRCIVMGAIAKKPS